MRRTGHCACGAVRLSAETPQAYHACHCDTCRRWTGGLFLSLAGTAVEMTGPVRVWNSSDWAERGSCADCGAPLFYRLKATGDQFFCLGLFDDLGGLMLTEQYYADRAPAHLDLSQGQKLTEAETIAKFTGP